MATYIQEPLRLFRFINHFSLKDTSIVITLIPRRIIHFCAKENFSKVLDWSKHETNRYIARFSKSEFKMRGVVEKQL